jgi:hypothetical protein
LYVAVDLLYACLVFSTRTIRMKGMVTKGFLVGMFFVVYRDDNSKVISIKHVRLLDKEALLWLDSS